MKDLTLKCKPELDTDFLLWAEVDDEPIVGRLQHKHGSGIPNIVPIGKYFIEDEWEEDDMVQSRIYIVGDERLKWQPLRNPWKA